MSTKETAHKKISELVERFTEQYNSYKKTDYNETLTRRDFIDPFFKALGWDIDNENGYAESYREVIHEDKVKIGKATKAPDYSFRLVGGKRLFFVEAKKPSVFIKDEIQPAYQVRRYGWSAKLAVSVITDFEEFAIYDCNKKPLPTDKASVARIKYLTFKDYLNEFDFLWDTFSKERVLQGSFDKFVQSNANKKGTATVDKEFLQSLDSWRTELAHTVSKDNKELNEDEINFAVQQTIDRIIFLRIAEDRAVEPYGNLKECLTPTLSKGEGAVYRQLFNLFQQADDKYNSGLFDFKKDKISKTLTIDNKVLKTIINQLYYPESPYEFSVLSVEILGSAYEQFLGKQIKIDKAHRAHIEEKPEVRKAGGVYYTPQYVVEYIVKNTVGKLAPLNLPKGERSVTPKDVAKIKIVDPACGSGSFLIGAYQYLLDWHLHYYNENNVAAKKDKALTPTGALTTSIKKQILLNNIYGVDIDVNAVEVTKLSLLLKCMEGETSASIAHQLSMFNERVLPTLDNNIKDGNSLVDTDFYASELDFGEEKKIKPFNWQRAFPEVFKEQTEAGYIFSPDEGMDEDQDISIVKEPMQAYRKKIKGGFDVVIGNPPYVRSQHLDNDTKNYLNEKFTSASYQPDLFSFFVDKGIILLHEGGKLGFIIPNGILTNTFYAKSRQNILNQTSINIIVDLKDKVFEGASVDTSIFVLTKENSENKRNKNSVCIGEYPAKIKLAVETPSSTVIQNEFHKIKDFVFNTSSSKGDFVLIDKIKKRTERLGDLCIVKNGMKVRKDYVSNKKEDSRYKKFLLGASVKPYTIDFKNKWVCYDKSLEQTFTNQAFREEEIFTVKSKLLFRQVMGKDRIFGTMDNNQFYVDQSVYILYPKKEQTNLSYLLGIVNSKMIYYLFSKTFSDRKETFPKIKGVQLSEFPIKKIENKNKAEVEYQNEIIKFVNQLLQLNQQKAETKLATQVSQLQGKIEYCENRINEIVYQLYELTEAEIKIIERK